MPDEIQTKNDNNEMVGEGVGAEALADDVVVQDLGGEEVEEKEEEKEVVNGEPEVVAESEIDAPETESVLVGEDDAARVSEPESALDSDPDSAKATSGEEKMDGSAFAGPPVGEAGASADDSAFAGATADEGSTSAKAMADEGKVVIREVTRELTAEEKKSLVREELKNSLGQAREKKHQNYEDNLQRIVDFIRTKGAMVTNQEIEEGLGMKDTSVTNRLNELVKRGALVKIGDKWDTKYRLKSGL